MAHLAGEKRFALRLHDVTGTLPAAAREVDRIYNLACPASPSALPARAGADDADQRGRRVAPARAGQRCGRPLLQASTSEVYGDPQVHPQPESYWGNVNPIGPRACYDEGKRCAETLCIDYQRERGVAIRIARIFNTYGPRMRPDDGRVV